MSLSRQKARVAALSTYATVQKRDLKKIRTDIGRWKRETLGRPESLVLAFVAGLAVAAPSGKRDDKSDGQSLPMKAIKTSFLAWRLFGNRITVGQPAEHAAND